MSENRDLGIEWLRVLSAVGIVWFHSLRTGSYWGYAGLVVFLLLMVMFDTGRNRQRFTSIEGLARRLLVPWIFWWLVFALINFLQHQPLYDMSHGFVLGALAGPSIHLWYLPFSFAVLLALAPIKRAINPTAMAIVAFVISMALIALIPIWRPASLAAGSPVAQWVHALVPVFAGVLLGATFYLRRAWLMIGLIAAALVLAMIRPFSDVPPIYLLGLAAVVLVLKIPLEFKNRLPKMDGVFGAMFGVYLVHPIALALLRPLTDKVEIAGIALAFAISLAGVLIGQWISPFPASLLLGTPMPKTMKKSLFRKPLARQFDTSRPADQDGRAGGQSGVAGQ